MTKFRLVSAYYDDFGPFDHLPGINDFISTSDPDDLKHGDILVVWGGADIHNSFYNKKQSIMSDAYDEPSHRDIIEWSLMKQATEFGIPIIGVCRGAQMLCALAGGYLIQHVEGHAGWKHKVMLNNGRSLEVNSIHHQMMMPADSKHELIAWTPERLSDVYYDEDNLVEVDIEREYIYFNEIKGFGVQWHPEMLAHTHPTNKFLLQHISERL